MISFASQGKSAYAGHICILTIPALPTPKKQLLCHTFKYTSEILIPNIILSNHAHNQTQPPLSYYEMQDVIIFGRLHYYFVTQVAIQGSQMMIHEHTKLSLNCVSVSQVTENVHLQQSGSLHYQLCLSFRGLLVICSFCILPRSSVHAFSPHPTVKTVLSLLFHYVSQEMCTIRAYSITLSVCLFTFLFLLFYY